MPGPAARRGPPPPYPRPRPARHLTRPARAFAGRRPVRQRRIAPRRAEAPAAEAPRGAPTARARPRPAAGGVDAERPARDPGDATSRSRCSSARRGREALEGDVLTLEFAPEADFHRTQMEEQRNVAVAPRGALRGDRADSPRDRDSGAPPGRRRPGAGEELTEESWISLLKDTFDATEVEETP